MDLHSLAQRLSGALHLSAPLIAIGFDKDPAGLDGFEAPLSPPAADGRSGRVPAGCVFWFEATSKSFTTVAQDHANCSVGSVTHGLATFSDVADNLDVAEMVASGWVTPDMVPKIPVVASKPSRISYAPLSLAPFLPDVVLARVNGRQLMVLADALPELEIQGKPQCHIVAVAKEFNRVAASTGCALSRARTGMRPEEMTCAIPGGRLEEVTAAVEATAAIDGAVARYAASDSRRFAAASG